VSIHRDEGLLDEDGFYTCAPEGLDASAMCCCAMFVSVHSASCASMTSTEWLRALRWATRTPSLPVPRAAQVL